MRRILVIRGGAIGDFVLTLPALKLLRDSFPQARLEILGYKHIIALAEQRFYAEAVRSIEYGALASFFARGGELRAELSDYFASFELIVSYLFDPDGIFEANVRRCGAESFVTGPSKPGPGEHAAQQLARPIAEQFGKALPSLRATLYPTAEDDAAAQCYLPAAPKPLIAIHPGSGSAAKNWPLERWTELAHALRRHDRRTFFVVIGGEADAAAIEYLQTSCAELSQSYIVGQPLTIVAAVLARCAHFVGHDSGISHIAAAVDTPCTLLFGPTDPEVWAPAGEHVSVIRPASQRLTDIGVDDVAAKVRRALALRS